MFNGISGIPAGHNVLTSPSLKETVEKIYQQFNPASTLVNGDVGSFLHDFVSIDHKDIPQCAEYYKKYLDEIVSCENHINNDVALFKALIDKLTEAKTDNPGLSADQLINIVCHKFLLSTIHQHIPTYGEEDFKISDPKDSKNDHNHLSRMESDLQYVSYKYNIAGRMIELECASTLISKDATQAERESIMEKFRTAIFKEAPGNELANKTHDAFANEQYELIRMQIRLAA